MFGFKEIVARLVVVAGVFVIVETRARYIYQPGPFMDCASMEIPCGGHVEESCNEYCESSGFASGSCNGHCCLCIAHNGMLPQSLQRQRFMNLPRGPAFHQNERPLIIQTENTGIVKPKQAATTKPKRYAAISDNQSQIKFANGGTNKAKTSNNIVSEDDSGVCSSRACLETASTILKNMDQNVSPCDDFYQFACGNFQRDTPIPDDEGSVTLMGSLTEKLMEQLREILEQDVESQQLPRSSALAKSLYQSCMNTDLLQSHGIMPLLTLLKSLGGWPVLEGNKWDEDWIWQKSVMDLRKSGIATDYFLKVSVAPDLKHPSRRILNIAEPILSFSKEQLRNPVFADSYRKYQVDVATLLGAPKAVAEMEMNKVFEFERMLANLSLPRELTRAHPLNFYHPMTISELQNLHPNVQWLPYAKALLPKEVSVDESQVINVNVPEQLAVLLNLFDKTDKRVLANYVMWRVSTAVLAYQNEDAIQIQQAFVGSVSGQTQRKPRWRECVDIVSSTLGQATGAMYVRTHFDKTSKGKAMEMVQDIRSAFADILATMDWMDDDTNAKAIEKVTAMKANIGYPEEVLNEDILDKLYDGLVLSPNNFFGNILNLTKGATNFGMKKLNEPVNKLDWLPFGKPAVVNAFYSPNTNSIQFPAGILQGHFFDKSRPNFMNYGAIGWVIGHEISHGFDDQGSHFDLNGEVKDWWNSQTKHVFHEKARCLVEQYGRFTYTDQARNITIPVNGIVSVGENIADNGGIKQAYKAYQAWVLRNGHEKTLPGLKYSPNQLFWISAANNWCSKVRPQRMVEAIQMGVHAPGEFRVRGSFANIDQFAKDFNCPIGTPMNPPTKCSIW